jgi:hypothetical protein
VCVDRGRPAQLPGRLVAQRAPVAQIDLEVDRDDSTRAQNHRALPDDVLVVGVGDGRLRQCHRLRYHPASVGVHGQLRSGPARDAGPCPRRRRFSNPGLRLIAAQFSVSAASAVEAGLVSESVTKVAR